MRKRDGGGVTVAPPSDMQERVEETRLSLSDEGEGGLHGVNWVSRLLGELGSDGCSANAFSVTASHASVAANWSAAERLMTDMPRTEDFAASASSLASDSSSRRFRRSCRRRTTTKPQAMATTKRRAPAKSSAAERVSTSPFEVMGTSKVHGQCGAHPHFDPEKVR